MLIVALSESKDAIFSDPPPLLVKIMTMMRVKLALWLIVALSLLATFANLFIREVAGSVAYVGMAFWWILALVFSSVRT